MRSLVRPVAVEIARLAWDQGFEGQQQVTGGGGLAGGERGADELFDLATFDKAEPQKGIKKIH